MKQQDLKNAMEQVHIQDKMQEDIIRNLRKQRKRNPFRKMGTLAAALLLAIVVIGIPAQATIRYLIKERMESLPKEEVDSLSEMLEVQEAPADSFSRPYSQSEKERMGQLYREYQKGTFPQEEIPRVDSKEQVEENMFCYAEDTSCFYFPDRELTDEELLEIIDFNYKREYALAQDPEVQAYRKEQEDEQRKMQALVKDEGGINMQQAIEIADAWMEKLYGVPTDGMEQNAYLDEDGEGVKKYCVNYSIQSQCYYYFFISAADGELLEVLSSLAEYSDKEGVEEDRATEHMEENRQNAEKILEEIGVYDTYKEVYCVYIIEDGKVMRNNLAYYFMMEDESGYRIDFSCEGNDFRSCQRTTLADFERRSSQDYVEERVEGAQVKVVTVQP